MKLEISVGEEWNNYRIDQFLNISTGDEISRTSIQKWIKSGNIVRLPEESTLKASYKVQAGESYEIRIPPRPKLKLEPIAMDIPVVLEEKDFIVINKPEGLASHGGPEDPRPSLVNGLLYHFKELSNINGDVRPGIVHRLDKPTSGLMIVAKNDAAHIALSNMFQNRQVEKRYYAWLIQSPKTSEGRIVENIARHPTERIKMHVSTKGRKAITNYKILKTIVSRKGRHYSLAEIDIETGRTHQIRVHFQHMNCPVVGDMLYSRSGKEFIKFGLLLFSQRIKFKHPFENRIIELELPLPDRFVEFEKEAEFH